MEQVCLLPVDRGIKQISSSIASKKLSNLVQGVCIWQLSKDLPNIRLYLGNSAEIYRSKL